MPCILSGRATAQRESISHLAHANGYHIAWKNVKRADMLEAPIDSFKGDSAKLTALILDNLRPLECDAPAPPRGRSG
jgi:fido (protein-threonine AMPylation protein)